MTNYYETTYTTVSYTHLDVYKRQSDTWTFGKRDGQRGFRKAK